jgi:hypothetical protein
MMSNNKGRPGIFSETQRIKMIGAKMKELAALLNNDECFVGRFPASKITNAKGEYIKTRLIQVSSPQKFYQLDEAPAPGAKGKPE